MNTTKTVSLSLNRLLYSYTCTNLMLLHGNIIIICTYEKVAKLFIKCHVDSYSNPPTPFCDILLAICVALYSHD